LVRGAGDPEWLEPKRPGDADRERALSAPGKGHYQFSGDPAGSAYNFDFLTLTQEARERDLEHGLLAHLRQFLIELGVGFAFVGNQVPLEVGGEDFKLDLLFYHLKLRCFVVIDLKMGAFKPEYAGKMNFYLSAIDDMLRHPDDKPSIGLVLCKAKNGIVAEYALRDIGKPLGISEFQHLEELPEQLKGTLPTIEEIEAELGKSEDRNPQDGEQTIA